MSISIFLVMYRRGAGRMVTYIDTKRRGIEKVDL
jgi:hypothetical protein